MQPNSVFVAKIRKEKRKEMRVDGVDEGPINRAEKRKVAKQSKDEK